MIILRTGQVATGYWVCPNCYCHNYPEVANCYDCNADIDGNLPEDEKDETE